MPSRVRLFSRPPGEPGCLEQCPGAAHRSVVVVLTVGYQFPQAGPGGRGPGLDGAEWGAVPQGDLTVRQAGPVGEQQHPLPVGGQFQHRAAQPSSRRAAGVVSSAAASWRCGGVRACSERWTRRRCSAWRTAPIALCRVSAVSHEPSGPLVGSYRVGACSRRRGRPPGRSGRCTQARLVGGAEGSFQLLSQGCCEQARRPGVPAPAGRRPDPGPGSAGRNLRLPGQRQVPRQGQPVRPAIVAALWRTAHPVAVTDITLNRADRSTGRGKVLVIRPSVAGRR